MPADHIIDVSTPRPPPAFRSIPSRRNYSREEQEALQRGSLTIATLPGAYAEGRRGFAHQCKPELPDTRVLSAEEDVEWRALWDEMLRLDRWFSGPLRDTHVIEALQRRSDELMAAAVQRLRSRVPAPSENTAGPSGMVTQQDARPTGELARPRQGHHDQRPDSVQRLGQEPRSEPAGEAGARGVAPPVKPAGEEPAAQQRNRRSAEGVVECKRSCA
ncbi:hypothetical protein B0H19DRAFT_683918 [Mycena capillaripes]|nr:hypothetical protein B0H19DRAFT_683918 [Mycena capillaripes]